MRQIGFALIDGNVRNAHSAVREFVYAHEWRAGDLVIYDNRATMHRARPFDDGACRRELRRVTTLDIEA